MFSGKIPASEVLSRGWHTGGTHIKISNFNIILLGQSYFFILHMSRMCWMNIYWDRWGQSWPTCIFEWDLFRWQTELLFLGLRWVFYISSVLKYSVDDTGWYFCINFTNITVGGWVGRWCWVASSAGAAGHPTTLAYSRARACCACCRCRTDGLFLCFFSSHLSYFPLLMPHLFGDGWTYWNIVGSTSITQR